jgi:hypothetical protein
MFDKFEKLYQFSADEVKKWLDHIMHATETEFAALKSRVTNLEAKAESEVKTVEAAVVKDYDQVIAALSARIAALEVRAYGAAVPTAPTAVGAPPSSAPGPMTPVEPPKIATMTPEAK